MTPTITYNCINTSKPVTSANMVFGLLKRFWNGSASTSSVGHKQVEASVTSEIPPVSHDTKNKRVELQSTDRQSQHLVIPTVEDIDSITRSSSFAQSGPTSWCNDIRALQSTFHSPAGRLNPRFVTLQRSHNGMTPPRTPTLGTSPASRDLNTTPASVSPNDIEMLDATFNHSPTPHTTPPKDKSNMTLEGCSVNSFRLYNATVAEEEERGAPGPSHVSSSTGERSAIPGEEEGTGHASAESSPPVDSHQEKPGPKSQKDADGMQFKNVEDYCPCGLGGGHFLVCGHTVVSKEPCGTNCKTPQPEHAAFKCEQCEEIVRDVCNMKLTQAEKDKINLVWQQRNQTLFIALCVEAVTRHLPNTKGNIAETVICMYMKDFGRPSMAYRTVHEPNNAETHDDLFATRKECSQAKTQEPAAEINSKVEAAEDPNAQLDVSKGAQEPSNTTPRPLLPPTTTTTTFKKRETQPAPSI